MSVLTRAGLMAVACEDMKTLCSEVGSLPGVVILSEEALGPESLVSLVESLNQQPPWSEVPLLILTSGGVTTRGSLDIAKALGPRGNFTLLERPVRILTLITAVRAALRSRRRQYEVRALLASEQAARAEAERANQIKDEFLATLSHELRTPLNAILGWSQLLERGRMDNEMLSEGIAAIARNARVQTQLIEDLLDLSRIVSGKMGLTMQSIDPAEVVDAALESVMPAANAKRLNVRRDLERSIVVTADSARLQQVVWNLLVNATKFTPENGMIQVQVKQIGDQVQIQVSDTGQGIDPKFIPYMFERFRQADSATTRRHGGLGIGLALVKQLVELHGGSVRAESPGIGRGATFSVSLPITTRRDGHYAPGFKDAASAPATDLNLDGLRVLVVDDEPDALALVKRMLERYKAHVLTATRAAEAIRLIPAERPDVLVSDIGMPDMDGYELIRRVRVLPSEHGGATPAAALTAFARNEDRSRALMAGYQMHIMKPVESNQLVAVVASLAGRIG